MNNSHPSLRRLWVAMTALAAVAGVQAQSSASDSSSRYALYGSGNSYMGLHVGKSDFSLDRGPGQFGSEKQDTAYSMYAGTYFSQNLGFEIGYTDFGRLNRAGGSTKAEGVNLSLVGRLLLGNSFNLLGKLGTTYARTDVSSVAGSGIVAGRESDFGWSYGVGAEYSLTPKWSAIFQYDEHDVKFEGAGRDRISETTLGARYRF